MKEVALEEKWPIHKYNYTTLIKIKPDYVNSLSTKFIYGKKKKFFNLSDNLWKDALFWQ